MKNQKGITLIALVVTIIVLLILAGISIAMLTGDNGIITRTNQSKMSQIEGQVKEEVKLAVQSAKIFAMQKSVETTGGGWFAAQATGLATVVGVMEEDLTRSDAKSNGADVSKLVGYNIAQGATSGEKASAKADLTITYTTPAYKEATNYTSAKIEAVVEVEGNNFNLKSIKHFRASTGDEASGVAY